MSEPTELCPAYLSAVHHRVNDILFKAGRINFSLSLSASILGSYKTPQPHVHTHVYMLVGPSCRGLGQEQQGMSLPRLSFPRVLLPSSIPLSSHKLQLPSIEPSLLWARHSLFFSQTPCHLL